MVVEIWSDIACPWCYIGKVRFEKALEQYAHASEVEVVWRSFELDPNAPRSNAPLNVDNLMAKYRQTREGVGEMMDRASEQAASEGLEFDLESSRHANTFDAHRLVHAAAASGTSATSSTAGTDAAVEAGRVMERLMRAQQSEGEDLSDHETLVRLTTEAGMDEGTVRRVLSGDDFAAAVKSDEERARGFGIDGVPYFVFDEQHGVSGAQPAALFLRALQQLGPQPDEAAAPAGSPVS